MTLALLVYLVAAIPLLGFVLTLFAIVISVGFALFFVSSSISMDVYGHYGDGHNEVVKAKSTRKFLRAKLWIPITLILAAVLIPSKTTIYTMIAAYAGQKIAETPQAQQIGNDAVDVLHELLAKAKKELKDDEPKKEAK